MSRNICAQCAKPVYHAERKTSLGRDWHPTCLRCFECGRVLSPGQHAEHKGNPYCHTPCYKALFGPALLGYGSNIASPANFAKKDNAAEYGHDYDGDVYKREIYSNSRTSAAARRQRQRRSAPPSIINHDFSALSKPPLATSATPAAVGRQRVAVDGRVSVAASADSRLGSVQEIAFTTAVISAPSSDLGSTGSATTQAGRKTTSNSTGNSDVSTTVPTNRVNVVSQPATAASKPPNSQAPKLAWVASDSQASSQHSASAGHGRSHSMVDPVPSSATRRAAGDTPLPADSSQSNGSPVRVKSAAGKAKSNSVDGSSSPRHVNFAVSDSHVPSAHRNVSVSVGGNSVSSDSQVNNGRVPVVKSVLPLFSAGEPRPTHSRSRLALTPALHDILEKVKSFNGHFEGKVHHQMTVEQLPDGEIRVQGPMRIYWGLSRPIRLRQCDDVPAPPIAKWRHSLCANLTDGVAQNNNSQMQKRQSMQSPLRPRFGVDDSILMSPASGDEVVMRRSNIRKFNTVAYRHEAPTKWKRASINGHIFNYDTSVFTPVLGSSTSVIADSSMTTPVTIAVLLDKFKVENNPGEYVLSVMTEKGDQSEERLLGDSDHPLLERLHLGANDQYAKIFLKERRLEPEVMVPDSVKLPIMEEEEEEEEMLPAEVEQLMILPVAVLKGIMVKYEKDEQKDVRLLKAKYDRVKRKIRQRLEELRTA